ncbi:hypothetical protein [Yoonia sp. R2-816]|uniref:hypothetical protein n=1 Tax=Yoonia sp. R2-816 TaxID=3342638 RepID=UPI00372D5B91
MTQQTSSSKTSGDGWENSIRFPRIIGVFGLRAGSTSRDHQFELDVTGAQLQTIQAS